MQSVLTILAFGAIILGGLAIGAWLVIKGHPWFALLVFLIISGLSIKQS